MTTFDTILSQKKFVKDSSLAFDFSQRHDVTVIQFMNYSKFHHHDLEKFIHNNVNRFNVNFVAVCGGSDTHTYRGNLDGFCDMDPWMDPFYIGTFLNELIVNRNHSKYIVGVADCGGAFPALLASRRMKYQSLLFTTPVLCAEPYDIFDSKNEKITASVEERQVMVEKLAMYREHLDVFPLMVNCINEGVPVNIHWANHVVGSDLYEKNRTELIQNKKNLNIVMHDMPIDKDPHFLAVWLYNKQEFNKLIRHEVNLGKIYLSSVGRSVGNGASL